MINSTPPMQRLMRRLVGSLLSTIIVVVPAGVFVRESLGHEVKQESIPSVQLSTREIARFGLMPTYQGGVPVITYHDIAEGGGEYTVTPSRFVRQIAMLRAAGFHSITSRQFQQFLSGTGTLPSKPILITFDDGASSAWRVADPVLERYGMHALLSVITGEIGKHAPYYLSRTQLLALRDSGRWDLEAHTDNGHRLVLASPTDQYGPFLTSLEWLPRQHRYETIAEYTSRVGTDLDRCIAYLRAIGVDPKIFIFPFSAATTPTNDPRVAPMLHRLVAARFTASLVDSGGLHRYISRVLPMRWEMPRFLVRSSMTAQSLFHDLEVTAPLPHTGDLARPIANWVVDQRTLRSDLSAGDGLTFSAPTRTWISARWAPTNALPVRDANLRMLAARLGTPKAGSALTLLLRQNGPNVPAAVTVGPNTLRIRAATNLRCDLTTSSAHRLSISYRGNTFRIAVDGHRTGALHFATSGGAGINVGAWRDTAASPQPVLRELVRGGSATARSGAKSLLHCTTEAVPTKTAPVGRTRPQQRSTSQDAASSRTSSPTIRRSS
jgi:peptidoglycan/xylan/chitin deacetylase (PgdA/CDA1 family)